VQWGVDGMGERRGEEEKGERDECRGVKGDDVSSAL
jgi:hypothetical protein